MIRFSIIDTISEKEASHIYLANVEGYSLPMVVKQQKNLNPDILGKLSTLNNPHLPKLLAWEEQDGTFTLLEEYIDGISLDRYFQEEKPDRQQTAMIFLQVCEALALLHSQTPPIIHRDIKPSNILISPDGLVRLIDFNASREYKPESARDTVALGTVNYAPPEQFGYAQTDHRSDIYSLGVTISHVTSDFPQIVKKCTMFDPKQRYSSIELLAKDLRTKTDEQPKETHRLPIVVSSLAAVFVLAALGFLFRHRLLPAKDDVARTPAVSSQSPIPAATTSGEAKKEEYFADFYNPETNAMETYTYYYLVGQKINPLLLFFNRLPKDEAVQQLRIRKKDRLQETVIPKTAWQQTHQGIKLSDDFIRSLDQDAFYEITMETSGKLFGAYLCCVNTIQKIPKYYRRFIPEPGIIEYLRDTPGDLLFSWNNIGQDLKKIVNRDTGETLSPSDYTIDNEQSLFTLSQDYLKGLEDDRHYTIRFCYTQTAGETKQKHMDIDAVVRQDSYVPPALKKKEYIFNRSKAEDLEIRLTWNDGKGHLQAIYAINQTAAPIKKKFYDIRRDSVMLSKDYLKKQKTGDHKYLLEFGEIGLGINIHVN